MDLSFLKKFADRRAIQLLTFLLFISLFYNLSTLNTFAVHDNRPSSIPYEGNPTLPTETSTPTSPPEDVVFVMIMVGEEVAREGAVAIKTALMHLSRPAQFHILCDATACPILNNTFTLLSRPANNVRFRLHLLDWQKTRERFTRAGVAVNNLLLKIFLHEMFYDVDRAIFFDTDMMFLTDPYLLWRRFDDFSDQVMASFPTQGPETEDYLICSCIMLLDLAKMRQNTFIQSSLYDPSRPALGNNETWQLSDVDPLLPRIADQSIYWAIWRRYPQYFTPLPLSWDTSHCRQSFGMGLNVGDDTTPTEKQVADITENGFVQKDGPVDPSTMFPGVIHYNCLPTMNAWSDLQLIKEKSPAWFPYVMYAVQYKWIWLNQGDGTSNVSLSTTSLVHFYDEIYSSPEILNTD